MSNRSRSQSRLRMVMVFSATSAMHVCSRLLPFHMVMSDSWIEEDAAAGGACSSLHAVVRTLYPKDLLLYSFLWLQAPYSQARSFRH
jgi:hypothetical protein